MSRRRVHLARREVSRQVDGTGHTNSALAETARSAARVFEEPIPPGVPERAPVRRLAHARNLIAAWRDDCNHNRPHPSLGGLTPWGFVNRSEKDQTPNRANF